MKKFLICPVCGNIVELIVDKNVTPMCCGKPMQKLVAGTTEAAAEKHIPVVNRNGNIVNIKVGSIPHPMEEEHYIAWIYVETSKGNYHINLNPGNAPEVSITLADNEEIINVYAYCNLHSLWGLK